MFGDFLVDMIHTLPPPIQWFIDCQLWSISPPAVLWPHLLFCRPHLHHTLMSCNATNVIKYFPQFKILRIMRGNNFRQSLTLPLLFCDPLICRKGCTVTSSETTLNNFARVVWLIFIHSSNCIFQCYLRVLKNQPHCKAVHRMTENTDHHSLPKVNHCFQKEETLVNK